ncbi:cold-shock protein [Pseudofrancisella aestuarii]|uniref:'Cold-shock' DNA-binding domain protein n=2 Tax=Francisellaceae TaxID=34064 RepID=A0A1J0KTU5_9GAMM|nr:MULTISPECIES: cold shock domain-containing protein [Francisellaceae]APC97060.1 'Cold-shock' DNA-binding domain protein [Francisella frigiditurris]
MRQGKIKFFNAERGFGFIEPQDGGKEIFVHINNVEGSGSTLQEGEKVTFDTEENRGRKSAIKVKVIS